MRERGFVQVLILVFLLAGIAGGTYLVQNRTNFFPKAVETKIIQDPKVRYLKIISPNGGEIIPPGAIFRIKWESRNINKVMLSYLIGSDSSKLVTKAGSVTNNGYFDWKADIGGTESAKVKISIIGYQAGVGSSTTESEGFFTVGKSTTASQIALQPAPFVCTPCAADLDLNGKVDSRDYAFLASCWNKQPPANGQLCERININGVQKVYDEYRKCLQDQYFKICAIPAPKLIAKRIFVTSSSYNGNLGGLKGADAKCQERAQSLLLGGTFKAWLSDSSIPASLRLNHDDVPYQLISGAVIANKWSDLTDGFIQRNINITEDGTLLSNRGVWTNTRGNGEVDATVSGSNCNNWTSASADYSGKGGNTTFRAPNVNWTTGYSGVCNVSFSLYCLEQ